MLPECLAVSAHRRSFGSGSLAAGRRRFERELRIAEAAGCFALHYQPRFSLATGAVELNEAFVHWPHGKHGLIATEHFIPSAERSDLIDLIGAWVLVAACSEAVRWGRSGLSVSISLTQLRSRVLPKQLATALERSGLPPASLEVRLPASILADSSIDTLLALSAMRDVGVGLALDGFGDWPAGLSTLKRLPLTVLKLGRSRVCGLPGSCQDPAVAHAVIATAHALRLKVAADGIDTEAQRAFLSGIGCDEGQGALFSEPLPAEQLRTRLGLARC
jgi:EAL domain-containing protein (putative c-di-GMP-specific phosphodiesterase class I)